MNKNLLIYILILCIIIYYLFSNLFIEKFTWTYNNKLPEDLWKNTCIILDYRYPLLWASCENDKGKFIDTSININKCYEDKIRNVDGILECL
jgi:hypothetical protein